MDALLCPYNTNKLENCLTPCIYIGYSPTQNAYFCLQPSLGRIYISRHVKFDETIFPYKSPLPQPPETSKSSSPVIPILLPLVQLLAPPPGPTSSDPHQTEPPTTGLPESCHRDRCFTACTCSNTRKPFPISISHNRPKSCPKKTTLGPQNQEAHSLKQTRQPKAQPQPNPSIIPNTNQNQPPTSSSFTTVANRPNPDNHHRMQTRRKSQIVKPNTKYNLSVNLSTTIPLEPQTVNQALKDKKWRGAMSEEIDAFVRNRTFDLLPRQPHHSVIGCKWIFQNKISPTSYLNRCKARLVAKGYKQKYARDYTDTFSPMIKSTTIRLVLDITISKAWPIQQSDVNNAFLQGTLTEEVYKEQPPNFVDSDNLTHLCRFRKAIYGLKQIPRAWYIELKMFLLNLGFKNSLADTSLFVL